jgi:hypothetical protein
MYHSSSVRSSEDEVNQVITRAMRVHRAIMAGFERLRASALGPGQGRLAAAPIVEVLVPRSYDAPRV